MSTTNLPHNSRQITVSPLLVRVTGQSIALASALGGTLKAPFLSLTITPSINQVVISSITVTQTGTIQTSTAPFGQFATGDGDLSRIYVYLDTNLNGQIDAGDTLLGSLPWGSGAGQFNGGVATIPLSVPQTFNTSGGTLLLAADVAMVDGSGASTQGHMVGLSLASAGGLSMQPATAVQDLSNVYPIQSQQTQIFNFNTIQISSISVRPDLTLSTGSPLAGTYFPDAWVNHQDQAAATWLTNPPNLPSNVSVSYQVGVSVSSNTAVPPTLTGWINVSGQPSVLLTGLALSDNGVYYFFVRTLTILSGVALPPSPVVVGTLRVDATQPDPPTTFVNLPKSAPSGVLTLQWPSVTKLGPSGLYGYKIRQFKDGNPVPTEIILTSTPSFTFGANLAAGAPHGTSAFGMVSGRIGGLGITTPLEYLNGESGGVRQLGHFYRYQLQTINGAGTVSDWSALSNTIDTGLPSEIISNLTNFPNPVDTRKGGLQGRTFISYLLASDAQVEIVIYDLLGYRVMAWSFPAGSPGGMQGANAVPVGGWDGTNESGQKVSKGGYLAQIKVSGGSGSSTVIRKIGVIH